MLKSKAITLKEAVTARQKLAQEASAAIDGAITLLRKLESANRNLRRNLLAELVRIDSARWLEGDTTALAVHQLRGGLGLEAVPPFPLAEAVEKESVSLVAAVDAAVANHGKSPAVGAWSGTGASGAPAKSYNNVR